MRSPRYLYLFNDIGHFRRFLWGLTFLAFFTGIGALFIPDAWATAFSCTGPSANGNLFDQDIIGNNISDQNGGAYTINTATPTTNSDPFGATCPQTLGIFGRILCFFKSAIGQMVSTMYCGMQYKLQGPLSIALELFIAVFGVMVMTGLTNLSPKESIVALLKIAMVWAFAMNATWGIGIAYTFFIGMAEQGSNMVINAVGPASGSVSGGGGYLTQPDNMLTGMMNVVSTGSGGASTLSLPANFPAVCGIWLVTFIFVLLLFLPMVAGFIVTMIFQYIMLYVRALLGYLTALVLISFLFILSPLFISFALFQITRPLFEQWLKYLTSFSLQMVIVFSFLILLHMIPLGAFFMEILSLLRKYDVMNNSFNMPLPTTFCSICNYTINSSGNIGDVTPPITCINDDPIPLTDLFSKADLTRAILSQIVALWIIGTVMEDFIKSAPQLASSLAGRLPFAVMLSGNANAGMAGGPAQDYIGLQELESGVNSLVEKISSSGARRDKIWARIAPYTVTAGAALAAAAALAKKTGGANSSADTATQTRGGTGGGGKIIIPKGPAPAAAAKKAAASATVMRNTLISNPRAQAMLDAMTSDTVKARQHLDATYDENYDQVQKALQDVEDYKMSAAMGIPSDPLEYMGAMRVLQNAKETWLIATSQLYESQYKDLRADKNLQEAGLVAAGSQGTVLPQNVVGLLSNDELTKEVQSSIKNLELQVKIQQQLSPGENTDRAAAALNDTVKEFETGEQTPEALQGIMQKLYEAQKIIT